MTTRPVLTARGPTAPRSGLAAILGDSPPIRRLRAEIARLAVSPWRCALVVGETGSGKELVPAALAALPGGAPRHVEVFNCPAVPADHLESELFGTTRGAFPGSLDRPGAVERAEGGILFLDELASMPLAHQAKVLRFVESGVLRRLGGTRALRSEAAVVAAANEEPRALVERGLLRPDLHYRLLQDGVLRVPPLRERPEDLALLAAAFLAELPGPPALAPEAAARLRRHAWPGNVRELRAVLRIAARLESGTSIGDGAIAEAIARVEVASAPPCAAGAEGFDQAAALARARMLLEALARAGGNQTLAGMHLGFHGGSLDLRARKLAHRRFRYWWSRLVEPATATSSSSPSERRPGSACRAGAG
jgi:DNA-binding NtrC family response regulator